MNAKEIMKIFEDTAYVRMGGSDAELRCAKYLADCCAKLGHKVEIEEFTVDMATIQEAVFEADGISIPCKGYFNAGSGEVEAPFYYLRSTDAYALSQCKGKIVMIDGYLGYWIYNDILETFCSVYAVASCLPEVLCTCHTSHVQQTYAHALGHNS